MNNPCRIVWILGCVLMLAGCAGQMDWFGASKPVPGGGEHLTQAVQGDVAVRPARADSGPARPVPLAVVHTDASFQLKVKGKKIPLHGPEDFVLHSRRLEKSLVLEHSDWVFVGYGLTIPALGWDHYQHYDVRGKTVVMLSGAPIIPDGTAVSSQAALHHSAGLPLGQWRNKFENARQHGAALALILHDPKTAGLSYDSLGEFPEEVVTFYPGETADTLTAFGWIPEARMVAWLKRAGLSWESLKRRAEATDFSPLALPIQGSLKIQNRWREMDLAIP